MAHIVLLALAAAVFPTLIACVAIMISRPEPRRLLVAFYAGGEIATGDYSRPAELGLISVEARADAIAAAGASRGGRVDRPGVRARHPKPPVPAAGRRTATRSGGRR
jgi:hypothetical protein